MKTNLMRQQPDEHIVSFLFLTTDGMKLFVWSTREPIATFVKKQVKKLKEARCSNKEMQAAWNSWGNFLVVTPKECAYGG